MEEKQARERWIEREREGKERDRWIGRERGRQVSIMFSDIVGFTSMAEALDPEQLIDVSALVPRQRAAERGEGGREGEGEGERALINVRARSPPESGREKRERERGMTASEQLIEVSFPVPH